MVKPFGASTQELHIYCINVNFIDRNNIASPQILLPHPKPKLKNKSPAIVYCMGQLPQSTGSKCKRIQTTDEKYF